MNKKNIKKEDFINRIFQEIGFSKTISENIVKDIFDIIIESVDKNENLKISNFGTFKKKKKNERVGRNPKTKEEKIISSRFVVQFKASKNFKKKINN